MQKSHQNTGHNFFLNVNKLIRARGWGRNSGESSGFRFSLSQKDLSSCPFSQVRFHNFLNASLRVVAAAER